MSANKKRRLLSPVTSLRINTSENLLGPSATLSFSSPPIITVNPPTTSSAAAGAGSNDFASVVANDSSNTTLRHPDPPIKRSRGRPKTRTSPVSRTNLPRSILPRLPEVKGTKALLTTPYDPFTVSHLQSNVHSSAISPSLVPSSTMADNRPRRRRPFDHTCQLLSPGSFVPNWEGLELVTFPVLLTRKCERGAFLCLSTLEALGWSVRRQRVPALILPQLGRVEPIGRFTLFVSFYGRVPTWIEFNIIDVRPEVIGVPCVIGESVIEYEWGVDWTPEQHRAQEEQYGSPAMVFGRPDDGPAFHGNIDPRLRG